eukprot:9471183-Pyramimonas_sp.AAC.1
MVLHRSDLGYRRTSLGCPPFSYVTCALALFGMLLAEYFLSSMTVMLSLTHSKEAMFRNPYIGQPPVPPAPAATVDDHYNTAPLTLCEREDYRFPSMLLVTPSAKKDDGSRRDAPRSAHRVYGGESRYVSLTVFGVEECPLQTVSKRCGKVARPAIALLAFAEDDDSIQESSGSGKWRGGGVLGVSSDRAARMQLRCVWSTAPATPSGTSFTPTTRQDQYNHTHVPADDAPASTSTSVVDAEVDRCTSLLDAHAI